MKYLIPLLFIGCSSTVTVPEKVYIPVKCEAPKTSFPQSVARDSSDYTGIIDDTISILTYTETIKSDLDFCKGKEE